MNERLDLTKYLRIAVPRFCKPTFATFNIRRSYSFHVKLTVECAQKAFKAEFNNDRVVVLAADCDPGGTALASSSIAIPRTLEEDVAPAYQAGPAGLPTYHDAKQS